MPEGFDPGSMQGFGSGAGERPDGGLSFGIRPDDSSSQPSEAQEQPSKAQEQPSGEQEQSGSGKNGKRPGSSSGSMPSFSGMPGSVSGSQTKLKNLAVYGVCMLILLVMLLILKRVRRK